jgi:glycosyltransferase involved in cell wall biosynthesis
MNNPKISIILPTYNGVKTIGKAIISVQMQTFTDWELIIVDDGSSDGISLHVSDYQKADKRIQYIKNEKNIGIQRSLNKAIESSRGKYIARIDDDDVWIDNEKLSTQFAEMEANPDCVLIGTNARIVSLESKKFLFETRLPETDKKIRTRMLFVNNFIHSSVIIRAGILNDIGGYSESEQWLHVEDYELWLRIGKMGKTANIAKVSVELAIHEKSLSNMNRKQQMVKIINLVKKYKDRYPYFYLAYVFSYIKMLSVIFFEKFLKRGGVVYRLVKRL